MFSLHGSSDIGCHCVNPYPQRCGSEKSRAPDDGGWPCVVLPGRRRSESYSPDVNCELHTSDENSEGAQSSGHHPGYRQDDELQIDLRVRVVIHRPRGTGPCSRNAADADNSAPKHESKRSRPRVVLHLVPMIRVSFSKFRPDVEWRQSFFASRGAAGWVSGGRTYDPAMTERPPLDRSRPLWGFDLRHAALALLSERHSASIRELIEEMARRGFTVAGGYAHKVLADALRHELRRGRVRRVGWGRYAMTQLPPTTAWRVRRRWAHATGGGRELTAR